MTANLLPSATGELEFKGIGVSPGTALGPAFLLAAEDETVVEREITAAEVPRELQRFAEALAATREQIRDVQQRVRETLGAESATIFEAHLLVLEDRGFLDEVARSVQATRRNIEAVVRDVATRYAQTLENLGDDYLRERAVDLRDIGRRMMRNLTGHSGRTLASLTEPSVLVARDLTPSETAGLNKNKVLAFVTDLGSPTSHTAIMARALGIPAIVGMHDVSVRLNAGDPVLVDGYQGLLYLRPTRPRRVRYERRTLARRTIQSRLAVLRDQPAMTQDGYSLILSGNIGLPGDVDAVLANGATGIGLFRTEYLYLNKLPTEEEQAAAYAEVARRVAPAAAIIRTMDIGGDKFLSHLKMPQQVNPFMGWRAIRFCLAQPEIFKTQLRAILRASVPGTSRSCTP